MDADGVGARSHSTADQDGVARVLIVEDDDELRAFMAQVLRPYYQVLVASDSWSALDLARMYRPNVLLNGLKLPEADGVELLAALRAHPDTATIPIVDIVANGAGAEAGAEAGAGAGDASAAGDGASVAFADDRLVRPFSSHALLARVRSALARTRLLMDEGDWRTALLSALSDGVCITDEKYNVVEFNNAFAEMVGYGREDLPYSLPYPWFPDPEIDASASEEISAKLTELFEAAGAGTWRVPHRNRDGRRIWIDLSNALLPQRLGPSYHTIGLFRDATAIHWSELRNRLLADVGGLLGQPGELHAQLDECAQISATMLDELVVIAPLTRDGQFLRASAAHPKRAELAEAAGRLIPRQIPPQLQANIQAGHPFVLDPVQAGLRLDDPSAVDMLRGAGVNSVLLTPLMASGRLHGVLGILSVRSLHGDAERMTAQELGNRITAALASHWAAVTARQLADASGALAAAATVAQASAALGAAVREALHATVTAIYVLDPVSSNKLHLQHVVGGGERHMEEHYRTVQFDAETVPSEAARTGESVWVPDQQSWRARYPNLPVDDLLRDTHASFAVPIRVGEQTLGVLATMFATPWSFLPDDRRFVQTLVTQAGQAFERAMLSDARWRVSRTLQKNLLPTAPPPVERLSLVTHYQPAGRDIHAGGDWHDVIVLDDTRIAIMVGDVVGNGPIAAATMGRLSGALAAYLHEGHGPGHALDLLSEYARHLRQAPGSTVLCLILDTGTGELRGASAGHPAPVLVDPAAPGDCHFWDELGGAALGVPIVAEHAEARRILPVGSSVLLYTDGLVERRREIIDDGLERLRSCVAASSDQVPDELLAEVLACCLPPDGPTDDVAAIIARYLPEPGTPR